LTNADAVILAEAVEQHDALLQHAVPAVAVRVVQVLVLVGSPFAEQGGGSVLAQEIGAERSFEGRPKSMAARVSFSCQPSR